MTGLRVLRCVVPRCYPLDVRARLPRARVAMVMGVRVDGGKALHWSGNSNGVPINVNKRRKSGMSVVRSAFSRAKS